MKTLIAAYLNSLSDATQKAEVAVHLAKFQAWVDSNPTPKEVKRPAKGTKTGDVWDLADSLTASNHRATRAEVLAAGTAKGLNPSTILTQYQAWSKAHPAPKQAEATMTQEEAREAMSAQTE